MRAGVTQRSRGLARVLVAGAAALPLVYLVLAALHPPGRLLPTGWALLPASPSTASFERAFDHVPFADQLGNSLLVVLVAVPVSILVASWAGFALALMRGPARRRAVGATLLLLAVPASAVWVPRFVGLSELGLVDSPLVLTLPALMGTTPLATLLFYWSYRRLPPELLEAARLEGLGPVRTWAMVALPLVEATATAVGVLVFIWHWGNVVDALLYLYTPDRYTVPLGLSQLRLLGPTDASTILAGSLVLTVPPVVLFALVQRRFFDAVGRGRWLAG